MKIHSLKLAGLMLGLAALWPLAGEASPEASVSGARVHDLVKPTAPTAYEGMNHFALAMYRGMAKLDWSESKGNFVFSPYSLSMALGMCQQGAGGKTLEEMTATLGLPVDKAQAAKLYGDILRELENSQDVSFRTANAIWWDNRFKIVPEFQKKTESEFLARLKSADFSTGESCEMERLAINSFAEERTQKRIKDLLPPNALIPDTASVLVNAVHFLGSWKTKFDPAKTKDSHFSLQDFGNKPETLSGKEKVNVPMMTALDMPANLARVPGWRALELPFKGEKLSFVVLLPEGETLSSLEAGIGLEGGVWNSLISHLSPENKVQVSLPKFKLDGTLKPSDTKAILSKLGMSSAFGKADFSAMCSNEPLFIGDIFHKAFIEVKEEGAEAAAATAVDMRGDHETPAFHADRPFIFAIRHVNTGAILFMGRVADPR